MKMNITMKAFMTPGIDRKSATRICRNAGTFLKMQKYAEDAEDLDKLARGPSGTRVMVRMPAATTVMSSAFHGLVTKASSTSRRG